MENKEARATHSVYATKRRSAYAISAGTAGSTTFSPALFDRVGASWSAWLAILTLAIAYGSLLPFDLDLQALAAPSTFFLSGLTLHAPSVEDLITNILVYLPLGLVFGLALGGGRATWWRAAAFGAILSLTLESMQTASQLRIASWIDVALNTGGSLFGVAIGLLARRPIRASLHAWDRTPFQWLVTLLTLGLPIAHLAPFEFHQAGAGFQESLLLTRWGLWDASHAVAHEQVWPWLGRSMAEGFCFLMLGFLGVWSALEAGVDRWRACVESLTRGTIVATVMVALAVFLTAPAVDFGAWARNVLCTFGGVVLAQWLVGNRREQSRRVSLSRAFPPSMLVFMLVVQTAAWLLVDLDTSAGSSANLAARLARWPLAALWSGSMLDALAQLGEWTIMLAALGATLCALLRAGGRQAVMLPAFLIMFLLVVVRIATSPDSDTTLLVVALITQCAIATSWPRPNAAAA